MKEACFLKLKEKGSIYTLRRVLKKARKKDIVVIVQCVVKKTLFSRKWINLLKCLKYKI